MDVFDFDVCVATHDALQVGDTCVAHMVVSVLADGFADGQLAALQMAAAFGMPTQARIRL